MPSTAAAPDTETLRAELRSVGLRVTQQRLAVLGALAEHPHADADTILGLVHRELPATSLQAVYGVLAALTAAELVRRVEPAHSPALYERKRHDNHHHLVCRRCHRVLDVPCAIGVAPCLIAQTDHGFVIDEAEVTFWGLCPDCVIDTP